MESFFEDDETYDTPRSPSNTNRHKRDKRDNDHVSVPPMNERPYYQKRLERSIGRSAYNAEQHLRRFDLETLKLMDAHHRVGDFGNVVLQRVDEKKLRSVLMILAYEDNKGYSFDHVMKAFETIIEHHSLDSNDLTKLHPKQVDMVAAAARFLAATSLNEFAPPKLTYYVMERLDDTDAIIDYAKQFFKRKDDANSVDIDHITQYIDTEAPALREGGL